MPGTLQSDSLALSVVRQLPATRHISLLGGFAVSLGDRSIALPSNVQRLVGYLALHDRPVSRLRLATLLWPESSEERAGASLRSALWRLRRLAPAVVVGDDDLVLSPDVSVDIHHARDAAERLVHPRAGEETSDLQPFLLDLLPDWYEDWVIFERERYRQTRLHALEALCELLMARKLYARAVDAGLAAVASEPLRETAQRTLIRAHLAEGNISEAMRQYRSFRQLLLDELGVAPSPELEQLIARPGH